jgi:hypothetical protein
MNPKTIVVDQQLAASERTTAQLVPVHFSGAVNGLSSLLAQWRPPSVPLSILSPSTAGILNEIFQTAQRAMEASPSSTASEEAKQAAEKAKTWSIIGAVFAVVVAIIVAIVVTVFTFGAGAPAGAGIVAGAVAGFTSPIKAILISAVESISMSICNLMFTAEQRGHPLAGQLAAAVSQIPQALKQFTNANRYDSLAVDAALRAILQALRTIDALGRASGQMTGPCTGDPNAVYQCGQQLGPLLARLGEILQTSRLLSSEQTQAAIRALQTAKAVLTKPRFLK